MCKSTFLKMAWRNLWRNPRRTLITISSITIGLIAIVFYFGFMDGMNRQTLENNIRGHSGHIKVYAKGYQKDPAISKRIIETEGILKILLSEPHVHYALPRINTQGLVATGEKSAGAMILGIDLNKEENVSDYKRYVREGTYYIPGGGILIGKGLAKLLRADIGDTLSIIIQAADGSMGAENYKIGGILSTGEAVMDNSLVVMSLDDLRALTVAGESVTEITVILESAAYTEKVMGALAMRLDMEVLELVSWKELLAFLLDMQSLAEIFKYVPLVILIVVASLGILNTVLMSVSERTRELGIMMALGTRPSRIVFLILLETTIIGIAGVILGVTGGMILLTYFGDRGIDFSQWSEGLMTIPFHPTTIYPVIEPVSFYLATGVVFVSAVMSALYPAYKAARLRPAEAIHFA